MECPICFVGFGNAHRLPRNINCGHSLCTECLEELVQRNIHNCPICRKPFDRKRSAEAYPKAYAIINLVDKRKQDQACKVGGLACAKCEVSACRECRQTHGPDLQAKLSVLTKIVKLKSRIALPEDYDMFQELLRLQDLIAYNLAKATRESYGISEKLGMLMTAKQEKQDKVTKYFEKITSVVQRIRDDSIKMIETEFKGFQESLLNQKEVLNSSIAEFESLKASFDSLEESIDKCDVVGGKCSELIRDERRA